jgi:hypothetical protein
MRFQGFQPALTPRLTFPANPPDGHFGPRQRIVTKGLQPEPALNPVRIEQSTQNNDIFTGQSRNYLSDLLGSVLLDQASDGRGQLGAILLPIVQTIHGDAQAFSVTGSNRVVEADTLNETTVTTITGIGNNHVVERALLGAATGKTDNNHRYTFVSWKKDPEL